MVFCQKQAQNRLLILTYQKASLYNKLSENQPMELNNYVRSNNYALQVISTTTIKLLFSFAGKLSTEINFIHDIIHDTNEPSQSLTVIDIHSNESTTTPWEIENSDEYVDVGAEGISPHHLRTSPASSTNFDHRQDNAPQITVDADGIDTNNHTDLRKRPPISPKPKGFFQHIFC